MRLSRTWTSILTMAFCLFLTASGCVNEAPAPKSDKIQVSAETQKKLKKKVQAVRKIPEITEEIIDTEGPEPDTEQVDEAFDSPGGIIDEVIDEDPENNEYTPNQLRDFINEYLVAEEANLELPDSLVTEIMKLKVVLLGGSEELVTDSELERLKRLLNMLKQHVLDFGPHISVIQRHLGGESIDASESYDSLEQIFAELGAFIDENESKYAFADAIHLSREVLHFLDMPQPEIVADIENHLPLITEIKGFLFDDDGEFIHGGQYQMLFADMTKGVRLWAELQHLKEGPAKYDRVFYLATNHFKKILERRETTTMEQISALVHHLLPQTSWMVGLREQACHNSDLDYCDDDRKIIDLWLTTASTFIARMERTPEQVEFTTNLVEKIEEVYREWSGVEKSLHQIYLDRDSVPMSQLGSIYQRLASTGEYFGRLAKLYNSLHPIAMDETGKTIIGYQRKADVSLSSAQQLNLYRMGVEFLLRHYSQDERRSKKLTGLTEQELQQFYSDIHPLATFLDFFGAEETEIGKRWFLEARLFTYNSDGDEWFEYMEAIELIANVYSGGFLIKQPVGEALKEMCSFDEERQEFQQSCVRQNAAPVLAQEFDNIAELQKTLQQMQEPQKLVEQWMRLAPQCGAGYDVGRLQTMIVLASYAEIIFTRFDHNKNQYLDNREVDEMFEMVKDLMADMVELNEWAAVALGGRESALKAGFYFILEHGRMPESHRDYLTLAEWAWLGHDMDEISRSHLLDFFHHVISSMAQESGC